MRCIALAEFYIHPHAAAPTPANGLHGARPVLHPSTRESAPGTTNRLSAAPMRRSRRRVARIPDGAQSANEGGNAKWMTAAWTGQSDRRPAPQQTSGFGKRSYPNHARLKAESARRRGRYLPRSSKNSSWRSFCILGRPPQSCKYSVNSLTPKMYLSMNFL